MKYFFLSAALLVTGCTDATLAKIDALGASGKVQCWSGTLLIYDGESTGKISNSEHSDGYYFMDKATGKLIEVSGNCVIRYQGR